MSRLLWPADLSGCGDGIQPAGVHLVEGGTVSVHSYGLQECCGIRGVVDDSVWVCCLT